MNQSPFGRRLHLISLLTRSCIKPGATLFYRYFFPTSSSRWLIFRPRLCQIAEAGYSTAVPQGQFQRLTGEREKGGNGENREKHETLIKTTGLTLKYSELWNLPILQYICTKMCVHDHGYDFLKDLESNPSKVISRIINCKNPLMLLLQAFS